MKDTNKLNPEIRFSGFTDDWEERKLGELGSVAMNRRIFKEQTSENEEVPFFKIGTFGSKPDAFISRELFEEYKLKYPYPEIGDILISASGSIGRTVVYQGEDEYFQDSNIVWLKHDNRLDNKFLKQFYSIVKWQGLEGSTIKRLYNKNILDTDISIPSTIEQNKIGMFFEQLDDTIALHQRKLNGLKNVKKAMLEKMFPKSGEKIPEIRFSGFTDDWEQHKLESFTLLITKQTGFDYSATIKPALVKKSEGNVYPFIQNKNFSGFKINMNTDFYIPIEVANKFPRIILDQPSLLVTISGNIGNVGLYNSDEKAFVGGAVGICKLNNLIEGEFILYELESDFGQRQFKRSTKSSSHANITVEMIKNIDILIPKNELEQKKIGSFFKQLDETIDLHQRKLDKLKTIKKAMLEKMFI